MSNPLQRGIVIALFLIGALAAGLLVGALAMPAPRIGIVRFESAIDTATATHLIEVIEGARNNPSISAVVVEILSPGGYATSSESIYHSLLNLREVKPVVASIDTLAASGGYFMAVASNHIVAPASAYVGNVGTRGSRPTDPEIYADELSSGPYKLSGGSRFDQMRQLELVADSFVSSVVYQRSAHVPNPLQLTKEEVAEARIYLGSEALALGLIDSEGSRTDAIAVAAELAGVGNYLVVDLEDYLGVPPLPWSQLPLEQQVRQMVASAPPDMLYMVDDRVALPGLVEQSALVSHLQSLRGLDATPLLPASGAQNQAANSPPDWLAEPSLQSQPQAGGQP